MKKLGGILTALIWLLFTVPTVAGGTMYYFEAVASFADADMIALLLWGSVMLLMVGLVTLISRWMKLEPGILRPGEGASRALEIICCIILVGAGIYFRIGQEFIAFWSRQDGRNPVVEAAMVTLDQTAYASADPVTNIYIWLLNQLFYLVGNLSMAAAGMQLVLFTVTCALLYFLVRRCYGALTAVICLGGIMLLPEMIRASMYCSPEILLFLIAVILGWVLHLTLDKRMAEHSTVLLDFLLLVLFLVGCVYVNQSEWVPVTGEIFLERILEVSRQTILVPGVLCSVIFLFLEKRKPAAAVNMMMAVLLILVQMLGLPDSVGCAAALGIVMSVLLGISLDGLLVKAPASREEEAEPETEEPDFEALSEENFVSAEQSAEGAPAAQPENDAASENDAVAASQGESEASPEAGEASSEAAKARDEEKAESAQPEAEKSAESAPAAQTESNTAPENDDAAALQGESVVSAVTVDTDELRADDATAAQTKGTVTLQTESNTASENDAVASQGESSAAPAAANTAAPQVEGSASTAAKDDKEANEIAAAAAVQEASQEAAEIYVPESMEIPKRKKRARIDFDREFSEEEMNFDIVVKDDEEFDR